MFQRKVDYQALESKKQYLLLSVIIPTCNRRELLALCLDRLAPNRQEHDFSRYEVIVSDDSETPDSRQMIESQYPWIRHVEGPRRGPASNRNNGARIAQGQWLVFTDDDCLPDLNWIEAYAKEAATSNFVLEGKTVCRSGVPNVLFEAPVNEVGGRLWSCNFAIRRDLFFKIGQFDERFPYASGEDEEFRERLKKHGIKFQFLPDAIVDHPPRRRPFGTGWRRRWQSQVLKEELLQKRICADFLMPVRIGFSRIKELRYAPSFVAAVAMMTSAIVEIFDIALRYQGWKKWAATTALTPRHNVGSIIENGKTKLE